MGDRVTVQVPESKRRSTQPREQVAAVHFRVALYLAHRVFSRSVPTAGDARQLRPRVMRRSRSCARIKCRARAANAGSQTTAQGFGECKVRLEHKGTGGHSTTHRSRLAVAVTNHFFLGRAQQTPHGSAHSNRIQEEARG